MNLPKKCEKIVFDYYNRNKETVCTRFIDSADINRESYKRGAQFTVTGISQPSDLLVTDNGFTFYAEVKCTENPRGLTQGLLKRQAGSRRRILAAGGAYLYYVYSLAKKTWYEIPGEIIQECVKGTIAWERLSGFAIEFLEKP